MTLYEVFGEPSLAAPALVAALDGWVDAGEAGTTAAEHLAKDAEVLVGFDDDALIDYRARRPTLQIVEGRMTELTWPRLTIRRVRAGDRDLLVLAGPEPDYRWHAFGSAIVELALRFGVTQCVSMGAIPAMVPHTRPTPVMTTGSGRTPADTDPPLPAALLQVPAAAVNLIEMGLAERGIASVGFWAQVPHYVAGRYAGGALALLRRATAHLDVTVPLADLEEEVRRERERLDEVVASRPEARAYLERLEASAGPALLGGGEGIAEEVERFLRETTGENRNPFEEP